MKRKPDHSAAIYLIAVFKLLKALLLLGVGIAALRLVHKDLAEQIDAWAKTLRVDPGNRYVQELLGRAANVSPKKIGALGAVAFLYAAMFGTEGVGLFMGKRWAEYMTVITTALLMPLEVYEIYHKPNAAKIAALVINAAAVLYLIVRLRRKGESEGQERAGERSEIASGSQTSRGGA